MNKKAPEVNVTTGRYIVEPDYDDISPELAEALSQARGGKSNSLATAGRDGGNKGIGGFIFGPNRPDTEDDLLSQAMELARAGNATELKAFIKKHKDQFDINGTDEQGRNLAHYAAMSGDIKTLHAVKKSGVDMTATDKNGNTIAHTACLGNGVFNSDVPEVSFIKTIERYGVDVTEPNNDGETPLDMIAPVNEEGERQVSGVVQHGMFGEGIDEKGRLCPVTFYGPNEPAEATARYLAKKEGDSRKIVSDTRNSLERDRDGNGFPWEQFNKKGLSSKLKDLGEQIKNSAQEVTAETNDDVINDAFKAILRGNSDER